MSEATQYELLALNTLGNASAYLAGRFSVQMTRVEAKSNLDARSILFNSSNRIFQQHGCGISREEVEGAAIIERNQEAPND